MSAVNIAECLTALQRAKIVPKEVLVLITDIALYYSILS